MNTDKLNEFENMKISERVRAVARDVKLCEEDPSINFDMDYWMRYKENGSCSVCVAGALMVKSLELPHYVSADVPPPVALNGSVSAFDKLRCGTIDFFLKTSGCVYGPVFESVEEKLEGIFLKYYGVGTIKQIDGDFYLFMEEVAVCLEREGL